MTSALSYFIIFLAAVAKLPQIFTIISNKSSAGIAGLTFYLQLTIKTIEIAYNMHIGMPVALYGELLFLYSQGIIVTICFWIYGNEHSNLEVTIVSSIIIILAFFLFQDLVPNEDVWTLIIQIESVLIVIYRMPQILKSYRNKSTGSLSFTTNFIGFFGL